MNPKLLANDAVGSLVACLCLVGGLSRPALAVEFTVDPERSSITLSGSAIGYPLQAQGPGSLTTKFAGTIQAEVGESSVAFTGGSLIAAQNNGDWQPKANGEAGSAPANYGGKADAGFLGLALAAPRNIQFDLLSGPLALTGGSFDSSSLVFQFVTNASGMLDYRISGLFSTEGSLPLAGMGTNRVATKADLVTSGTTQTLTLPINTDFYFKLLSENDTKLTVTGQFIATRTVGGTETPFDRWVAAEFPGVSDPAVIGPEADPDKDGLPNFVEFAFGLNPLAPDSSFTPLKASLDPADPTKLMLQYLRPKGLSGVGVNYSLYFSDNLTDWNKLEATEEITDLGGVQEEVTVHDPVPVPTRKSRYVLLVVEPVR